MMNLGTGEEGLGFFCQYQRQSTILCVRCYPKFSVVAATWVWGILVSSPGGKIIWGKMLPMRRGKGDDIIVI